MTALPGSGQSMLCPVCKVTLSISERQGVEIDFCPQCRGVWLDRGELDKIIERSEVGVSAPPQVEDRARPGRSGHDYDDRHRSGHHGQKRRRGFLSDLFD